jgi:hypothetical protein
MKLRGGGALVAVSKAVLGVKHESFEERVYTDDRNLLIDNHCFSPDVKDVY